jgi:hypothetical protein
VSSYADTAYLEAVHQHIWRIVELDNRLGGSDLARLAVRFFRSVHQQLGAGAYEPAIERDLQAAAGELAEVAGWLFYDANRQDDVRRMNQEALYFSRLAGDRRMELLTLQNASMHAGHLGRPREALHLARSVLESRDRLSPRVKKLFLVRKARALAQGGDEHALRLRGMALRVQVLGNANRPVGLFCFECVNHMRITPTSMGARANPSESTSPVALNRSISSSPPSPTSSRRCSPHPGIPRLRGTLPVAHPECQRQSSKTEQARWDAERVREQLRQVPAQVAEELLEIARWAIGRDARAGGEDRSSCDRTRGGLGVGTVVVFGHCSLASLPEVGVPARMR